MAKACQLFSGSSGNSIYITSGGHHYLVDIGVSAKRCENALKSIGVEPEMIEGIFVTHEHGDHASGVRVFAGRHNVPVYSSQPVIDEMERQGLIDAKVTAYNIESASKPEGIEVVSFHQSHDSVDCLGYRFNLLDKRSISVCTDTGYITDDAREKLLGTKMIFLESNHEVSMLQMGAYPYPLKKRILGPNGHLSNLDCAQFIKELAESGTNRFILAHLSRENNTPDIARQSALSALNELGLEEDVDFRLYVSPTENFGKGISI